MLFKSYFNRLLFADTKKKNLAFQAKIKIFRCMIFNWKWAQSSSELSAARLTFSAVFCRLSWYLVTIHSFQLPSRVPSPLNRWFQHVLASSFILYKLPQPAAYFVLSSHHNHLFPAFQASLFAYCLPVAILVSSSVISSSQKIILIPNTLSLSTQKPLKPIWYQ